MILAHKPPKVAYCKLVSQAHEFTYQRGSYVQGLCNILISVLFLGYRFILKM